MERLFKTFASEAQPIPDSRQIKFLISTGAVDRDGDTLNPKGWDLTHYKKSPVVLWSHDYGTMPIAKATNVSMTEHGLSATAEFPAKGVYPFADTVYDMIKGGFLSATSVGFRPIESQKAEGRSRGYDFLKQELLEFSVVPVPANPEALIQRGVSTEQAAIWKAYLKKEWVESAPSFWDAKCQEFDTRFAGRSEWAGKKKEAFLADVKIESNEAQSALGEARIQKLLDLNGLSALLQEPEQVVIPVKDGETERDYIARSLNDPQLVQACPDTSKRLALCYGHFDATKQSKNDTIEIVDELTLDVVDDLIFVEERDVQRCVESAMQEALAGMAHDAAIRAINRARGKVL
jgi:HK97 family phage prohead protease